jgi:hypothetical protein
MPSPESLHQAQRQRMASTRPSHIHCLTSPTSRFRAMAHPNGHPNGTSMQSSDSRYSNTTNDPANTAANGLFLLLCEEAHHGTMAAARMVTMIPPFEYYQQARREARGFNYKVSASPPPHHLKLAPPKPPGQACGGCPTASQSVATRSRLKIHLLSYLAVLDLDFIWAGVYASILDQRPFFITIHFHLVHVSLLG